MTDEVDAVQFEIVEERNGIRQRMLDVAVGFVGWTIGLAEATLIGRNNPKTGADQSRDLLPPQPCRIRKPVQHQNRATMAFFGDAEFEFIDSGLMYSHMPAPKRE